MTDERRRDGDDLDRRIALAKQAHERPVVSHAHGAAEGHGESKGWAVGIEFVGTTLVGGFVGWLLDNWLGTKPWLMIALLVLGFAAGLRRAWTMSQDFDTHPTNDRH